MPAEPQVIRSGTAPPMTHPSLPVRAVLLLLGGAISSCGGGPVSPPPDNPISTGPSIQSFAASSPSVFVGERTMLTAIFTGTSAEIAGLGSVQSGQPLETLPLPART